MQREQAPIGIFDSGVGGLSVWREIVSQLPAEDTLYFADQAHIPYGPRQKEEIRAFAFGITEFLLKHDVKTIVVACNTASGAALQALREAYPEIPFVGMEPAVKPASERTQQGAIGVLATPTTFEGPLFRRLVDRFGNRVEIHTQVCPGLVEAVEAGALATPATRSLLETCLSPLIRAGVDQLVLGCTHYPFVQDELERILGPGIAVIDPAPAVARQVGRVLTEHGIIAQRGPPGTHRIVTTGMPDTIANAARRLVRYSGSVQHADWQGPRLRIA
ncbi:MAG: glutamate racemase [Anaerolineae bacterium]